MNKIPVFFKSIKKSSKPKAESDKGTKAEEANSQDINYFADLHALLNEHRGSGDFGQHNVKNGHHIAFKAGKFVGSGKVTATGQDGVHVRDSENREHRIHWHEVTGHYPKEDRNSEKDGDV